MTTRCRGKTSKLKRMDRLVVAALCTACALSAQTANPLSTELVRSYDRIKGFLVTMAEKMPAEDYGFQPTPTWKPSPAGSPILLMPTTERAPESKAKTSP